MVGARHIFETEGNLFDSLSNGAVASVIGGCSEGFHPKILHEKS